MEHEDQSESTFSIWFSNLGKRWYVWVAGALTLFQLNLHEVVKFLDNQSLTGVLHDWNLTLLHGLQATVILVLLVVFYRTRFAGIKGDLPDAHVVLANQQRFCDFWIYLWVAWLLLYAVLTGFSFAVQNRINVEINEAKIDETTLRESFYTYCSQMLGIRDQDIGLSGAAVEWWFTKWDLAFAEPKTDERGKTKDDSKNLIIVTESNKQLHVKVFDGDGVVVVDADEIKLNPTKRELIDKLRDQAKSLWGTGKLSSSEKETLIPLVTRIAGLYPPVKERYVRRAIDAWESTGERAKAPGQHEAVGTDVIRQQLRSFYKLLRYRDLFENALNNCQTLASYLCYFVLAYPASAVAAAKAPLPYGLLVVAMLAILQAFGILGEVQNKHLAFFGTVSAVAGGVVFALFFARLESKRFKAPTVLIAALYFYAVWQTRWALERDPSASEGMTDFTYGIFLVFKMLFFFYILWLLQSGHMLYYFHHVLALVRQEDNERAEFAQWVEPAGMAVKPARRGRMKRPPPRIRH
jgi:hypothetical protein